jgi:hypothetical protein
MGREKEYGEAEREERGLETGHGVMDEGIGSHGTEPSCSSSAIGRDQDANEGDETRQSKLGGEFQIAVVSNESAAQRAV